MFPVDVDNIGYFVGSFAGKRLADAADGMRAYERCRAPRNGGDVAAIERVLLLISNGN